MKNGMNIGGSSELVHEICTTPEEAIIRYGVRADWNATNVGIQVRSIRAGTIRVARDFCFDMRAEGLPPPWLPSPVEYLLTSLGGCVLFTWVQGCTVKGITIQSLSIEVQAEQPGQPLGPSAEPARPLEGVRYRVAIDCDGSREQIQDIARKVTCFSPSHRTFVEANQPRVAFTAALPSDPERSAVRRNPRGAVRQPATGRRPDSGPLRVTLDWRYGAHFNAAVRWGDDRPSRSVFDLDQPKQLNGQERAPNPQEFMMAALAGELLIQAQASGGADGLAGLMTAGDVDLRGFFNTGQTDVVKVHNIAYELAAGPAAETIVPGALARSVAHQTVVVPTPIAVSVFSRDAAVLEMRSDEQSVGRILAGIGVMETFQ